MTNHLYSYIFVNSVPALIGLKCGACYLNSNLQCPIIYPRGYDISVTNLLRYTYVNGQFYEQIIRNGLSLFVDADHACAVADCRSISCILFMLLGVTVHWKVGKHPFIATNSTDSEVRTFYIVTKMAEYICHIL